MFFNRIAALLRRRRAAAELNIRFDRSATFRLPQKISLNGRQVILSLPDEKGIKVAFIELLLDDCYGCRELSKKDEKIQTVLDIGANVGLFGIAARNIFPSATIHSYEPNKQLEPYLAVQAGVAGFDYFMEAVGLEDGMISLDINEDSVQTRTKLSSNGIIQQISFAKAIDRIGGKVDLLKMDCEGAEWEIFRDRKSWERVGNISMEYHLFDESVHNHQEARDVVQDMGFVITKFRPIANFGLLNATRVKV
jgi:FkbM family methyltransferase